ncbi:IS4 family transposase [Reyranella sp. CPCC 100927]|uniref:IS4 family transposase n=1 Tax=Reyranella sp. CPCC 100927 TaxID=2599616 RepID=UPI0011B43CAA|nr:IS4 family transposase [Reyranella sp. CPCC 100927]TWS92692.1 IS4 family transposase [Reyranella sp. CPCC 100927]
MLSERTLDVGWSRLLKRFGQEAGLEASAKRCGALVRRREIRKAGDLLRLALAYGPCRMSLRSTAAWASISGIAEMSDVAVLKRLQGCADWLETVAGELLACRVGMTSWRRWGRVVRLYDATTVSHPGSERANWRLHATYDPEVGRLHDFELTDDRGGETLKRARVSAGEIWVADRGLAHGGGLAHVVNHGADFVVRIGWNSLALRTAAGRAFDLAARLAGLGSAASAQFHAQAVSDVGEIVPVRLLVWRKPPQEAAREIKRIRDKAARRGCKRGNGTPDPRSLVAARYIILASSLEAPANQIFELYRLRWQIELAFKRLKSLLHFDELQAKHPELARTWLLAHLIAALVIDDHVTEALDTPPSAHRIAASTASA